MNEGKKMKKWKLTIQLLEVVITLLAVVINIMGFSCIIAYYRPKTSKRLYNI